MGPITYERLDKGVDGGGWYLVFAGAKKIGMVSKYIDGNRGRRIKWFGTRRGSSEVIGPFKTRKAAAEALLKIKEGEGGTA